MAWRSPSSDSDSKQRQPALRRWRGDSGCLRQIIDSNGEEGETNVDSRVISAFHKPMLAKMRPWSHRHGTIVGLRLTHLCAPASTSGAPFLFGLTIPTNTMNGDQVPPHQLENENAELRSLVAALQHEVADLRASALLWRKLYEDASNGPLVANLEAPASTDTTVAEPFPPHDGPEVPSTEPCRKCGRGDVVTVTPFIWKSISRLLFWQCGFCEHIWITDERRDKERR